MKDISVSYVRNNVSEDKDRYSHVVFYPTLEKNLESSHVFPAEPAGALNVRKNKKEADEPVPPLKKAAFAVL